tara:strand:+ start:1750 stop:2064 length:315 start_codon:yes stop_codon:yes gene_type:complete
MAIDRYEFSKQQIDQGKGKRYNTTLLPTIEKSFADRYIFTREGDRLDLLANEFYGDPRHWIILAMANNLGKGTLSCPDGIQLRIPPESIITELRDRFKQTQEER